MRICRLPFAVFRKFANSKKIPSCFITPLFIRMLYLLICLFSACECNGHAESCDLVTGECDCLARYVTGKNCER